MAISIKIKCPNDGKKKSMKKGCTPGQKSVFTLVVPCIWNGYLTKFTDRKSVIYVNAAMGTGYRTNRTNIFVHIGCPVYLERLGRVQLNSMTETAYVNTYVCQFVIVGCSLHTIQAVYCCCHGYWVLD